MYSTVAGSQHFDDHIDFQGRLYIAVLFFTVYSNDSLYFTLTVEQCLLSKIHLSYMVF